MIVLAELLLFTLCTASLGHFVQLTFGKGMIFRKYYGLIFYYLHFKPRKKYGGVDELNAIQLINNHYRRRPIGVYPKKWYAHLFEPLGGCPYCNGEWIFILVFLAYYLPLPIKDGIVLFLLGSGTNYIWIEILSKVK